MMARYVWAVLLAAVSGCAGTARGARVAVLPEAWATSRPAGAPVAAPRLIRGLSARGLATATPEASATALAAEREGCLEDVPCLKRVGTRLGADKVVTVRLAELGRTVAIQLALVDVARGTGDTLREVVSPADDARLGAALDTMAVRVARQAGAPERRGRPWLWVGAGGIAAGLAVTAIVLAVSSGGAEPDTTIVPP
jgi:hypothetical protein